MSVIINGKKIASNPLLYSGTGTNTDGSMTQAAITDALAQKLSTEGISKARPGYVRHSNGLIIQWGMTTFAGTGTTVTFPTPFTSATSYSVTFAVRTETANTYVTGASIESSAVTATSFRAHGWNSGAISAKDCYWIAIGY